MDRLSPVGDKTAQLNFEAIQKAEASLESRVGTLETFSVVESWHQVGAGGEPAFQNSWVNVGGATAPVGFYKDPFGVVRLRGAVKSGSSGSATIFTLPAGYRPAYDTILSGVNGPGTVAFATVAASGAVSFTFNGSTLGNWLDGISFRAEQ